MSTIVSFVLWTAATMLRGCVRRYTPLLTRTTQETQDRVLGVVNACMACVSPQLTALGSTDIAVAEEALRSSPSLCDCVSSLVVDAFNPAYADHPRPPANTLARLVLLYKKCSPRCGRLARFAVLPER